MEGHSNVDLVVVGAGWHGLIAAKTYLDLNPSARVLLLESAASIGGTWAKERLYPGLKSNNVIGSYEYSDFPMDEETYGVKPGEHIPGAVIHRYLTNYAQHFGFYDEILFKTQVVRAEHQKDGGWLLTCSLEKDGAGRTKIEILTSKMIIATGLTSEPNHATFAGDDTFEAPLFHCKDFLKNADTMKTAQRVCCLGATKSAWDVAYAYASHGIKVDMIVRESGHGPAWMSPPYVTPLKQLLEKLVVTRFLTWLSPCIWGHADGYPMIRTFLHGTAIGRFFVNSFWSILGNDVLALNKYDSNSEMAKLKPWTNPMFIGAGLSIINYETDFFEYVRNGMISVHVSDISHLKPKIVCLTNDAELPTDAFIYCTGWKQTPNINFIPPGLDLGLPHTPDASEPMLMTQQADHEILTKFPRLKDQPTLNPKAKPLSKDSPLALTPYRLYRFMVPPSQSLSQTRDIAFTGFTMTIATVPVAQIQALWIAAYFSHDIILPSQEEVEYQTILHSRFGRWRTPQGYGSRWPDLAFDTLPYQALMLRDLGLDVHRKRGWREWIEPYGPGDYRGLVNEWKGKRRVRREVKI